jgi:hypothetical protein
MAAAFGKCHAAAAMQVGFVVATFSARVAALISTSIPAVIAVARQCPCVTAASEIPPDLFEQEIAANVFLHCRRFTFRRKL